MGRIITGESSVQGSDEWLALRTKYLTASEVAAVMGKSPFSDRMKTKSVKAGKTKVFVNKAMKLGSEMEPVARAAAEEAFGKSYEPSVWVDDENDLLASVDGMDFSGEELLEIKIPFKAEAAPLWEDILDGNVPEHYLLQVQTQMAVTGAKRTRFFVWSHESGDFEYQVVERDEEVIARIRTIAKEFMDEFRSWTGVPVASADPVWDEAVNKWQEASSQLLRWKEIESDARKALIALAGKGRECEKCKVTVFEKKGAVDYSSIPQLAGVDLEQFRKAKTKQVKVTSK